MSCSALRGLGAQKGVEEKACGSFVPHTLGFSEDLDLCYSLMQIDTTWLCLLSPSPHFTILGGP